MRNFGINRVLEPKSAVPVAAWKIDNDIQVRSREARICLEKIHIEWDNFQQICNSCGFDEIKIKAKIMDIVEKRGKLQNPFTETGGIFSGTVEEIASDFDPKIDIKTGDNLYCITSLCGLPLNIESIDEIDYNYGQIKCTGYAIIFEATSVCKMDNRLDSNYTLAAIDEAGNLFSSYNIAKEHNCKHIAIIGRNVYATMMYAAAFREAIGPEYYVVAILDQNANDGLSQEEIRKVMYPLAKETFFVDVADPINSYKIIKEQLKEEFFIDQIIVEEDIYGAESLGVLLVRDFGHIYFASVANHYTTASMLAENMGKFMTMYAYDQYIEDYPTFTLQMVRDIKPKLEELNQLFSKHKDREKTINTKGNKLTINDSGKEDDFVYQSLVTKSLVEDVLNISKYDCNVIIQGETGVGKEKVLSLIHQNSDRRGFPCIKINCATIQENLAESEFFGYEPGAFTGAQSSGKKGYFEMANNGILFLDEIGTLSMNMQSKLLRVLQESQFYRVGGTTQISVNVRVIVANNVPLKDLIEQRKFREDLFYRLNICNIDVPPLRDRREDIICLSEAFVSNWTKKYKVEKELSPDAIKGLYDYYWPGNVRELENVIHRLIINSKGVIITGEDVEELLNESAYGDMIVSVKKNFNRNDTLDFHQFMEQQEKQIIEYALKKEGTTRKAADLLGLPQTTFARKKLKYNL